MSNGRAHVLIGFAEALPAPEVVFSLLSAGYKISAFARNKDIPLRNLPVEIHKIPIPEINVSESCRALRNVVANIEPDVILPLDDVGLWLCHHADLDKVIAGAYKTASEIALDKVQQVELAEKAGFSVPETQIVNVQSATSSNSFRFPAIIKPAQAVEVFRGRLAKNSAKFVSNLNELEVAGEAISSVSNSPWIMQSLIRGYGEGLFGFATDSGSVCAISAHRRLRMMNPHGSGASASVSASIDTDLLGPMGKFIRSISWRGPFMIELLRDLEGRAWFIELNGRMWGSMALARRQGLEYPEWSVKQALTPGFEPEMPAQVAQPVTVRHLGRDILHLGHVVRGPRTEFHGQDWPSLVKSMTSVLKPSRGTHLYNFDSKFPRYYLTDTAWTLKNAFRR